MPASSSGPGAIVLQEWWGLVNHIKDVADRLAADMYHGETTISPDDAGKLMRALDIGRAETDLRGAIGYLLLRDEVTSDHDGAGHAFFNDTRPEVYHEAHAATCWSRMLAFYRDHVR